MMSIKIATLNLCLGLKNKKDLVKDILLQNQIAVLSLLQETEIEKTVDKNLLRIPGFNLELENNSSVVYFNQQTHACAWVRMVKNDQKHSKMSLFLFVSLSYA